MKVFILEDDPQRMRLFHEALIGVDVTHAWSADEGLAKFQGPYDVVLLDHDLGGEVFVPVEQENTGSGFLRRLPVGSLKTCSAIVVHSYNSDAAKTMLHLIYGQHERIACYMPFGSGLLKFLTEMAR